MTISLKDVEHVAKLARLALTEDEKQKYAQQLTRIIEHFQELAAVNTEGVEPMAHVLPIVNVLRQDEVLPSLPRQKLMANAPSEEKGYFRVPKIGE